MGKILDEIISKILTNTLPGSFALVRAMKYIGRERKPFVQKTADYVRISSLELIADEIYENERRMQEQGEGSNRRKEAVAELGVYRGDYARLINEAFPDRKLYLFDTFEGFDDRDAIIEREKGFSEGDQDFSETNAELVISKMKYPENCIVKKGYFPDTAKDVDETFVFVSIDADLYEPIYNGLVFFYGNLESGGTIFVHDYNNDVYRGAKEAVRKFCAENNIRYFPLSDTCGTAVTIKP